MLTPGLGLPGSVGKVVEPPMVGRYAYNERLVCHVPLPIAEGWACALAMAGASTALAVASAVRLYLMEDRRFMESPLKFGTMRGERL